MLGLLDTGARSRGYETPGMCRGILRDFVVGVTHVASRTIHGDITALFAYSCVGASPWC